MATKKQPVPAGAKTIKAAAPKKSAADVKKLQKDYEQLVYDTTKVIVPLWFGLRSVEKAISGQQMRPEAALCLLIHGAAVEQTGSSSVVSVQIAIRPCGFSRFEALLMADLGTSSLFGAKLVKYVKKPKDSADNATAPIVLTAKGQKLFDLAKGSILAPAPWAKAK